MRARRLWKVIQKNRLCDLGKAAIPILTNDSLLRTMLLSVGASCTTACGHETFIQSQQCAFPSVVLGAAWLYQNQHDIPLTYRQYSHSPSAGPNEVVTVDGVTVCPLSLTNRSLYRWRATVSARGTSARQ